MTPVARVNKVPGLETFVAGARLGVTLSSSLHPLSASGPVVQIWPAGRVP
jgi:spore maturation protein SpmB